MTIPIKPLTLEEYLSYDDGTDTRYELVDGRLTAIAPVSDLADRIASFLYAYFLNLGLPHYRLSMRVQIVVGGKLANVRQPDLMVLSEEVAISLEGVNQRLITHDMPPPTLVIEIVSPQQEECAYGDKRTEYAGRHIPEFWIVNPINQKVTVIEWVNGLYEGQVYQGDQAILSLLVSDLTLTAAQVLAGKA